MNIYRERLALFQENMKKNNVHWAIIPTDDYHLSEYPADYFKVREYLSGFTGTNGTLVISENFIGLWTDGRYFLQAEKELEDSSITLMKMGEEGVPTIKEFLSENLEQFDIVWVDGRTISISDLAKLKKALKHKDVHFETELDPISAIWQDRPEMPNTDIWHLEDNYSGKSALDKLTDLRSKFDKLGDSGVDGIVITKLDDIAWLYNLRANDISYTPVKFSYSIVTKEYAVLYTNLKENEYLNEIGVIVKPYERIFDDLRGLKLRLLIDPMTSSYAVAKSMKMPIFLENPISLMKAVKNDIEVSNSRVAHIHDGIALTETICYLKKLAKSGEIYSETELSIEKYLTDLRKKEPTFLELSFASIVASGDNAAIIHYEPTEKTNRKIEEGFLLIDTGAHYQRGTTDVTRTVSIGETSYEMKKNYTAVLKGHLSVMAAKFKEDTPTYMLDGIARKPLRDLGLDYRHGTGHGVGYLLSVHEGPNSIRMKPRASDFDESSLSYLKPNMITSDEPGVYIEGRYGIRIENLLLTIKSISDPLYLGFEALTMAPYDRDSIIASDLTDLELKTLNSYHEKVYSKLSHFVSDETREWLKMETAEIKR